MVAKGLSLPESHRQAISNGLRRYYSMNEMSQERKDNISAAQKKRLAKRDVSQIQAHKEAISHANKKYYETHDGLWKGIKRDQEHKNRVSETLRRVYANGHTNWNAKSTLSEEHKKRISNSLKKAWKSNRERKLRSKAVRKKISESLKKWYQDKKRENYMTKEVIE